MRMDNISAKSKLNDFVSNGTVAFIPVGFRCKTRDMLNNRIERMFDICNQAKYVFFVFHEYQNYRHMTIDDNVYQISNIEPIKHVANEVFGKKCFVVRTSMIKRPSDVLNIIQ